MKDEKIKELMYELEEYKKAEEYFKIAAKKRESVKKRQNVNCC